MPFNAPANLKDFDRGRNPQDLRDAWHGRMLDAVSSVASRAPAFLNAMQPPAGALPAVPEWSGLPRAIKRLQPGRIAPAAALVDNSVAMGDPDPMVGRFTPTFLRRDNGQPFPGPRYRPQDEYLEWVTKKDAEGVITEVLFTCEGPEYWETIAEDSDLLLTLYKEIVGDNSILLDDLRFPVAVSWRNPNTRGGSTRFAAGDYNPYNKWNIAAAVHLTHPANTLGAEIALAGDATLLYGNPLVTTDPALVCCAGYGGINRMSDPMIGSTVNGAVRARHRVGLRNPIGLYIKDIKLSAITLSNDRPLPAGVMFFEPLRPVGGGEMIVRARFKVPDGVRVDGRQVRAGDLKVSGERVVTGGQLADLVNIRLFALHVAGAPAQTPKACVGKPCKDKNRPEFIHLIGLNAQCPPDGIEVLDVDEEEIAGAAALSAAAEDQGDGEKYATSRAPRMVR